MEWRSCENIQDRLLRDYAENTCALELDPEDHHHAERKEFTDEFILSTRKNISNTTKNAIKKLTRFRMGPIEGTDSCRRRRGSGAQ